MDKNKVMVTTDDPVMTIEIKAPDVIADAFIYPEYNSSPFIHCHNQRQKRKRERQRGNYK